MDKTTLHITEYRGDQELDFFGITSFKVQNHGEAVVEINTIPIYPGKIVKIIEEDSTQCDFKMIAKFTEEGKIPKFRAIYKQFGNADCYDHLHQPEAYKVTLYNYDQGDVIDFSQNISGHTILTRSFDGGFTFPIENDIDLGFIEANQVVKYDLGGSLDTNAIQFRNDDLAQNSEIFVVGVVVEPPFAVELTVHWETLIPERFAVNFTGEVIVEYRRHYMNDGVLMISDWQQASLGNSIVGEEKDLVFPKNWIVDYSFIKATTGEKSQIFFYPQSGIE